jgi:hypothetical protein
MANHKFYSIESIEAPQQLRNLPAPTRTVEVRATNKQGMMLITFHDSWWSAQWQRDEYRRQGYSEIS